jgi:hypothetical protein
MSNNWGGKREGAGSGGKRKGAGRKRTRFTFNDDNWIVETSKPDGLPTLATWTLLHVGEHHIEFQNTETEEIIVIQTESYYNLDNED